MSSWVDRQRQKGFILWKRYLAMGLHFKEGSSYDYGLYGGSTNVTMNAFLNRPADEKSCFIKLSNRLADEVRHDEFLFANIRKDGQLYHRKLLDARALDTYVDWKHKYGSKEAFSSSVKDVLSPLISTKKFPTLVDLVIHLLDTNSEKVYEPIAFILQRNLNILTEVIESAESNILHKIHLQRSMKVQKLYSYLCII